MEKKIAKKAAEIAVTRAAAGYVAKTVVGTTLTTLAGPAVATALIAWGTAEAVSAVFDIFSDWASRFYSSILKEMIIFLKKYILSLVTDFPFA